MTAFVYAFEPDAFVPFVKTTLQPHAQISSINATDFLPELKSVPTFTDNLPKIAGIALKAYSEANRIDDSYYNDILVIQGSALLPVIAADIALYLHYVRKVAEKLKQADVVIGHVFHRKQASQSDTQWPDWVKGWNVSLINGTIDRELKAWKIEQ